VKQPAIRTEFEFVLPIGYVDSEGTLHKKGLMRLATAADEIAPLRDNRVRQNQAYLVIVLLSRVITKLGTLTDISPSVVEGLFSADLAFLQNFYRQINETGTSTVTIKCPDCGADVEVDVGNPGELPITR